MTMRDARWGTRLPCERDPRGIFFVGCGGRGGRGGDGINYLYSDTATCLSGDKKKGLALFPLNLLVYTQNIYIYVHSSIETHMVFLLDGFRFFCISCAFCGAGWGGRFSIWWAVAPFLIVAKVNKGCGGTSPTAHTHKVLLSGDMHAAEYTAIYSITPFALLIPGIPTSR